MRVKSVMFGGRIWKPGSPNGSVEAVVRYAPGFILVGPHDECIRGAEKCEPEYETEDQVRKACTGGVLDSYVGFYKAHGELVCCQPSSANPQREEWLPNADALSESGIARVASQVSSCG
jgi:hypothetical protein